MFKPCLIYGLSILIIKKYRICRALKPAAAISQTKNNFDEAYIKYVALWLDNSHKTVTERRILDKANYFEAPHVFLTPSGDFAILDFDTSGNEFFRTIDISEIDGILEEESNMVFGGNCTHCPYVGVCLTEHYRKTDGIDNIYCSGGRILIDAYHSKMEGKSDIFTEQFPLGMEPIDKEIVIVSKMI